MANTRFSYVKKFEQESALLPDCWPLIRVDGRSFSAFSKQHGFRKPSEPLALGVMNAAAAHVMAVFEDIELAYGHSDEYRCATTPAVCNVFSFLLRRETRLYNRRLQKILSSVVSAFSAAYCFHWRDFFPDRPLRSLPTFDGRVVLYPRFEHVVDYFSWRHADCHINNQYNICFWCLVADGRSHDEAYQWLKHTQKGEKNEYIFQSRGINYNSLPRIFRKGTTLVRLTSVEDQPSPTAEGCGGPSAEEPGACLSAPGASSGDVIALTIPDDEITAISRKLRGICDPWRVGVVHCDNISAHFWAAVAPCADRRDAGAPRGPGVTLSALSAEQIAALNNSS